MMAGKVRGADRCWHNDHRFALQCSPGLILRRAGRRAAQSCPARFISFLLSLPSPLTSFIFLSTSIPSLFLSLSTFLTFFFYYIAESCSASSLSFFLCFILYSPSFLLSASSLHHFSPFQPY